MVTNKTKSKGTYGGQYHFGGAISWWNKMMHRVFYPKFLECLYKSWWPQPRANRQKSNFEEIMLAYGTAGFDICKWGKSNFCLRYHKQESLSSHLYDFMSGGFMKPVISKEPESMKNGENLDCLSTILIISFNLHCMDEITRICVGQYSELTP